MINDYTGEVLHDARYRDLVNEAQGSRLLRQAGRDASTPERRNAIRGLRPVLLGIIILVIGLTIEQAHILVGR